MGKRKPPGGPVPHLREPLQLEQERSNMLKRFLAALVAAGASTAAMASVTLGVDIYGPGDGATAEVDPSLVVVDVLIAANPNQQVWTAGGVRVATSGGATLVYS